MEASTHTLRLTSIQRATCLLEAAIGFRHGDTRLFKGASNRILHHNHLMTGRSLQRRLLSKVGVQICLGCRKHNDLVSQDQLHGDDPLLTFKNLV